MPPCASGPVFTVSRPMRTGLFWATAGNGSVAATAVLPTRKARRLTLTDMSLLLWTLGRASGLASDLERGRFLQHAAPDRPVAQLGPDPGDLGQDDVGRREHVHRIHGPHPARP